MSTISSQFSYPLNRTLPLTTMSTPAANQGRFAGDKTLISQVPDLEINVTGTRAFQRYPQIKSSVLDEITRTKGWKDIGVLNIPAGREFKPVKLYRATVDGRDVYAIIKPDTKDVYIPMASVRSGTPYKTISDRVTDLVRGQFNNPIRVTTSERSIGTPRVNAPIRPGHNGGSVEPSTWTQKEQDDFIKWMVRTMPVEKSAIGWTSIFVTVMSDPALRETVSKQYLTNKDVGLRDIPEVVNAIKNTRNKVEDAADVLSLFGFLELKGGSLAASVAQGTAKAKQVWNQMISGAQRNVPGDGIANLFKNLTVNPFSKMREAVGSRGWAPLKNLIPGTVDAGKQLIGGAAVTGWNALKNPRPVIDAAFKAGLKVAGNALDPTKPIALQIPTLIQNFPKPAPLKPGASAQEKFDYKMRWSSVR